MRRLFSVPVRPFALLALLVLAACSGGESGGDPGPTEPPEVPQVAVVTSSLSSAVVGTAYTRALAATGGDGSYRWSVQSGALPPGITVAESGSVSGTPTEAGEFGFTVSVASGGRTASRALTISVTWPPLAITTSGLPDAFLGSAYLGELTAIGGDGAYAWGLAAGQLPAGLSLSSDGRVTGTPTGVGAGTFTVSVVSAGDTATRALSIDVGAPQVVIQTTALANGAVGDAYAETLTASGGDGTYQWTVASGALPPGLALSVDGTISGAPTTVGSYDFLVQATSAGLTGTRALTLGVASSSSATPPTVTGTTPSVLIEGQTAVIEGTGFDLVAAQNLVTLGGEPVSVTSATATQLTVSVPSFDCLPPRGENLRVIVGGLFADTDVDVSPYEAGGAALDAGFYTYTLAGDGCIQLPQDAAGGEYLIGVTSVSQAPSSVTPIRLSATAGDAGVLSTAPRFGSAGAGYPSSAGSDRNVRRLTDAPLRSAALGLRSAAVSGGVDPFGAGPSRPGSAASAAADGWSPLRTGDEAAAHLDLMEESARLIDALGRPAHPRNAGGAAAASGPEAAVPTVGETITVFSGAGCTNRPPVQALVRYVGDNAVWLEDTAAPDGTFTEQEFADLDRFYSDNVQTVHDDYFGTSSDVDANERVLVLMTPEVNDRGVLGFVWSGDFFPTSQCTDSNAGEVFYGLVPDTAGVFGTPRTKEFVLDLYPELTTHEITHIVQISERLFGTADNKTTWETEGGATFAEQIVALPLFGHAQGGELGYEAWQLGIQWYIEWTNGLVFLYGYQGNNAPKVLQAPEECTWLGRESQGNTGPCGGKTRAPYDVPSFFLRAILDRFGPSYPGGEAALMKRLTQSPFGGWDAIGDVTGRPIEEDLAEFYMTLWGDGLIGDLPMMTTWDLFDIFSNFVPQARLQPKLSFAPAFENTAAVRAGSNYYLHWTPDGALAPTSVRLTSSTGASTPPTVSVWVLRIR
jgi:hypothetical protein